MENNYVDEQYYLPDTNSWIDDLEKLKSYNNLVVLGGVLRELDKLKGSINNELAYRSRCATRFIKENKERFIIDMTDYDSEAILGDSYTNSYTDNRIVACLTRNPNYTLITNDVLLLLKAQGFGLPVIELSDNKEDNGTSYTGIKKVYIDSSFESEQDLADFYQDLGNNKYNLLTNQYIIFYDKEKPIEFDDNKKPTRYAVIDKFRFDGTKHVKLKLPDKRTYVARNEEQECAADLLLNQDVPIKIIAGTYGSGKTMSAIKLALDHVLEKGHYSKIMMVRNPIGSGESIGWLKGSKEDKTEGFFKSMVQHLNGGEQEAEILKSRGQLLAEIPYYMKGLSIDDTFIIADEAEDFDTKLFKLVGTRLGENSAIAFTGDFNQVEDKYKNNNGMMTAIRALKGDPLVGIVVLEEDVRSAASKVFSKM